MASGDFARFSLGTEQIIALNYENLCDSDYLNRLFLNGESGGGGLIVDSNLESSSTQNGASLQGDNSATSSSNVLSSGLQGRGGVYSTANQQSVQPQQSLQNHQTQQNSSSQNNPGQTEGWSITSDMPEDIIVFGDAIDLGQEFQEKRFLGDISTLFKTQDVLSAMVYKQVIVFEHIGKLMLERCAMANSTVIKNSTQASSSSGKVESESMNNFATDALLCAIRVLDIQSRQHIRQSTVEPLLSLVVSLLKSFREEARKSDESAKSQTNAVTSQISRQHLQYLRSILCNGLSKMAQESSRLAQAGTKETDAYKEELLRLALCCSYGLLTIGLYSDNTGDVLIAIAHLMAVSAQTEAWLEDITIKQPSAHTLTKTIDEFAIADNSKKLSIKAKFAEKDEAAAGVAWNPSSNSPQRPNSGNTNPANVQVKTTKFLDDEYESSRCDHIDDKESGFNKTAGSSGRSWEKASMNPVTSVSALKVILDKDAKSKIRVVKSRMQYESSVQLPFVTDELATVGISLHMQQQQPTHLIKEKGNQNQKFAKNNVAISNANNNNEDRQLVAPGRPSSSKAVPVCLPSPQKNPKPLKDVIRSLCRIPKSILAIVQDSSANMRTVAGSNTGTKGLGEESDCGIRGRASNSFSGHSYVWTCGQNSYGELGHGDVGQRKVFTKAHSLEGKSVVSIGAGNEHSVFVTKNGQMLVCGYNDNGQCGLGSTQQVKQLTQVTSLQGEEIVQVHIYNGCEHTMAISRDGKLYSFGYNYRGQLGIGTTSSEATPRPVKSLLSRRVILAACSYHHSMILCADGALFSVGRNDCGQLGHGDTVDRKVPQLVQGCPKNIVSISCGQFHTIASTSGGQVYVCGKNDYGQLGFEAPESAKVLTKLPRTNNQESVVSVCSGYYHTLLLLQNGIVLGFGRNDYGQLGLGHAQPRVYAPHVISSLRDKNVVTVSAGCYHSIAVTSNGMLYVFGRNNHGQLGTGDIDEKHLPHPVDAFVGQRVIQVAAGFYHTIVLTVDAQNDLHADSIANKDDSFFSALLDTSSVEEECEPKTAAITSDLIARSANSQDSPIASLKHKSTVRSNVEGGPSLPSNYANLQSAGFSLDLRSSKCTIRELLPFLVGHLNSLIRRELSDALIDAHINETGDVKSSSTRSQQKDFHALLPCLATAGGAEQSAHLRDVSWVCRQLRSISTLLSIARQCVMNSHTMLEIPLAPDETIALIRTLLRTSESLFMKYSSELITMYRDASDDSISPDNDSMSADNGQDAEDSVWNNFTLHPLASVPITAAHIVDNIHKNASEFFQASDEYSDLGTRKQSAIARTRIIRSALGELRQELLQTYFYLPQDSEDNNIGEGATSGGPLNHAIREVASCITRYFDVLFPTAPLRSRFFCLLGHTLTAQDLDHLESRVPVETENECANIDYNRCLNLFSHVCFKYRGNTEVVKLFRASHFHGLVVFQQLLSVNRQLSMRCLNQKLQQHLNDYPARSNRPYEETLKNSELFRALGVLEHCNANFVKCAIPIIFSSNSTNSEGSSETSRSSRLGSVSAFGLEIIRDVFKTTHNIIDFLLKQPITEEFLNILRCDTVTPSVLSPILMLGISFAKPGAACVQDLLPEITTLLTKLQMYGRFELDGYSVHSPCQSPDGFENVSRRTASPDQNEFGSRFPALSIDIPSAPSPIAAGESNVRRDISQVTWWSRLLKLSVILSAKLSASLLADSSSGLTMSKGERKVDETECDAYLFARAAVWRYLSCPINFAELRGLASIFDKDQDVAVLNVSNSRDRPDSSQGAAQLNAPSNQHTRPGSASYRVSSVSSHMYVTPLRFSVRNICTELRQREMITDHTYRAVCQAPTQANSTATARRTVNAYLEDVEQMLLDVIVHVDGSSLVDFAAVAVSPGVYSKASDPTDQPIRLASQNKQSNKRLCRMWSCVAKITKLVHSKRSQLMESLPTQHFASWADVVVQLHKLVTTVRELLLKAQPLMVYSIRPLPFISTSASSSAAKRALRRCVMVAIISLRWQACCRAKAGGRWVGESVVQFFTSVIEKSTASFTVLDCDKMKYTWQNMMAQLSYGNSVLATHNRGIAHISSLLQTIGFTSMRNDVLAVLMRAWRDSLVQDQINSTNVDSNKFSISMGIFAASASSMDLPLCCSAQVRSEQKFALHGLIQLLVEIIANASSFTSANLTSTESQATANEVTELFLAIKLLHLYCLSRRDGVMSLPSPITSTMLSALLLNLVCDGSRYGFGAIVIQSDEKMDGSVNLPMLSPPHANHLAAGKKPNSREKNRALRRTASSIVFLLQELSAKSRPGTLDSSINSAIHSCDELLNVHCNLLTQLQHYRIATSKVDIESGFGGTRKPGDPYSKGFKDWGNGGATAAGSSANTNKRRCQELITKPMEFCCSQEGFVVQGDKLLNNYKGMDFTLATWILVSRLHAKNNFVTGKVSHNDAWPLISIKCDGKLEILYGHGSEFERLTSQASLPLLSWAHIAVVVEPKKIKLFINGVLDSQVNTKGNGRSILYPVVVGSCPVGVRTRVDHVREGFDGLLALYKYYTRALSPIHIRVVFDQGPPESYDVLERWIYQLLAPVRSLAITMGHSAAPETIRRVASTLHMLFVTDVAGRLRCGALLVLKEVLCLDVLTDFYLSANRSASSDGGEGADISQVDTALPTTLVTACSFLQLHHDEPKDPMENFRQRMVLYFIRLLGACWVPLLTAVADDSLPTSDPKVVYKQSLEHLFESMKPKEMLRAKEWKSFLEYAPSFISERSFGIAESSSPNPIHTTVSSSEKQGPRADFSNELCTHVVNILHDLSLNANWNRAITAVLSSLFADCRDKFSLPTARSNTDGTISNPGDKFKSQLVLADVLGCAVFLGGFASDPHVGTNAETYFSDSLCRVLSINKTTNFAAVLSWNNAGTMRQISTLRVNDIVALTSKVVPMQPALIASCISMLDSLKVYANVLLGDLMSLYRPDHNYSKHVVLKACRPVEIFIFAQLLQALSTVPQSLLRDYCTQAEFMSLVQHASARAVKLQSSVDGGLQMEKSFPSLWMHCARYLYLLPDDVLVTEFPPTEGERHFQDYLAKHMGITGEAFHQNPVHDKFLKQGLLSELVQCIAFGSGNNSNTSIPPESQDNMTAAGASANSPTFYSAMMLSSDSHFCVTDWLGYITGTGTASAGVAGAGLGTLGMGENDTTESESASLLKMLYQMRKNIILSCRVIARSFPPCQAVAVIPKKQEGKDGLQTWEIVSWLSLVSTSAACNSSAMRGGESFLPHRINVTQCLASSLRYMSISLLQLSSSKNSGNILQTTDILIRLVRATSVWIELHHGQEYEYELCFHLLRMLLPSLSFIENPEVELQIMKISCQALRRLTLIALSDRDAAVPKDMMDFAKSNNFTLLRARAQEQLSRHKGQHANSTYSSVAFHLTQLTAGLEIIQRRGCFASSVPIESSVQGTPTTCSSAAFASPSLALKSPRPRASSMDSGFVSPSGGNVSRLSPEDAFLAATITASPRIINARANSVDADLNGCAASVVSTSSSSGFDGTREESSNLASPSVKPLSCNSSDNVLVEVAIGVIVDGEETIYETVYCGSSFRFVESGLISGCSYNMRCRAIVGAVCLQWSAAVPFRTEQGVPFTFDPLKRGPDILLSDDGLTASYAGDDSWSTLFGTQSFSSGVTSWEIRIAQSSTAYVFVGVASSAADLNTFLGGCPYGWGFIGEQALYHNREKVKIYGESFSAGDIVGVILDLNGGTLSFSRNGKMLGVAFDKIYGELFPAVAFYNVGQELEIVLDGFHTTCPAEPIPCSPCRLLTNDASTATELMICINERCTLSPRLLNLIAEQCNQWCSGHQKRFKAVSGLTVLLETVSPLLQKYGLLAGERVRTPFGVAEVAGSAFSRVWFVMNEQKQVWFFSRQQMLKGRENGMFYRCTYETAPLEQTVSADDGNANPFASIASSSLFEEAGSVTPTPTSKHLPSTKFDAALIADMLHPSRWSAELDAALVSFVLKQGEVNNATAWSISASTIQQNFRSLQQILSKIVRNCSNLTHRWGFAGPKRRAVIARIGMLRLLNCMLDQYLDVFLDSSACSDGSSASLSISPDASGETLGHSSSRVQSFPNHHIPDEFTPFMLSVASQTVAPINDQPIPCIDRFANPGLKFGYALAGPPKNITFSFSDNRSRGAQEFSSLRRFSGLSSSDILPPLRECIFTDIKMTHFWEVVNRSAVRSAKTDDDYDYPEDLPQIKINRLKSFRAREASELYGVPGEDLIQSSMLCQLWKELHKHSSERMRVSYTHPMDDGQARTFKIRFDGEGVDDYGGPYREIFQQICDELQKPDPSELRTAGNSNGRPDSSTNSASLATSQANPSNDSLSRDDGAQSARIPVRCFLPLLHPTPNWRASECSERYCYVFHPASCCDLRKDLFRFMGELVGIALRSRVTLDLSFPSFIWKSIVKEQLRDTDIASFDAPASDFVQHLIEIQNRQTDANTAEAQELLQDLTWTAVRCDGRVVELVPGGVTRPVLPNEIREYVTAYVESRLGEFSLAIECFCEGLTTVIPESAICLLKWEELRTLVCGSRGVDVSRLRENTEYDDDVSCDDPHIVAFWEVLESFSEEEKISFLRFVWARPTLPPKGVAFPQKMKIQSAVGDDAAVKPDQYLPRAHTCFFSINLPRYSSKEVREMNLKPFLLALI